MLDRPLRKPRDESYRNRPSLIPYLMSEKASCGLVNVLRISWNGGSKQAGRPLLRAPAGRQRRVPNCSRNSYDRFPAEYDKP
jgi:hypothetical protein